MPNLDFSFFYIVVSTTPASQGVITLGLSAGLTKGQFDNSKEE
jgi:hypothetical protein